MTSSQTNEKFAVTDRMNYFLNQKNLLPKFRVTFSPWNFRTITEIWFAFLHAVHSVYESKTEWIISHVIISTVVDRIRFSRDDESTEIPPGNKTTQSGIFSPTQVLWLNKPFVL